MKHITRISSLLTVSAMAALLTACKFEQEDFFEESAALRIENTKDAIQQNLTEQSADGKNGWLIQYFVAGTDDASFEGFNLFGRFYESGKVVLSSDHRYLRNGKANTYTESASVYEMLSEEGPVLAFDTWNDVLSVFVDPVSPSSAPSSIVDDGVGMNGDDRLVFMGYTDEGIHFKGERHRGNVYFIRLDRTPEQYIADVKAIKAAVANSTVTEYKVVGSDTTVYLSGLNNGYFKLCDRLDDPLVSNTYSCVFTPSGFRMANYLPVGSDTCSVFVVNADTTALESGNVRITPCWGRVLQDRFGTTNKTKITADGASDSFAALYNQLAEAVHKAFASQTFQGITFGRSTESGDKSRAGLVFTCSTTKTKYTTGFTGTITIDEDNRKATISVDSSDASSNFSNYSKKGVGADFTSLIEAMNGTYSIQLDSPFNPTKVVFTKDGDSSFYFTVIL